MFAAQLEKKSNSKRSLLNAQLLVAQDELLSAISKLDLKYKKDLLDYFDSQGKLDLYEINQIHSDVSKAIRVERCRDIGLSCLVCMCATSIMCCINICTRQNQIDNFFQGPVGSVNQKIILQLVKIKEIIVHISNLLKEVKQLNELNILVVATEKLQNSI